MKTSRVHLDSTTAELPRQSKVRACTRGRTVNVRVSRELAEAVRKAAKAAGISRSKFVRLAVWDGLRKIESGKLQMPKGGAR
jgi:predicted DNA binding CopG/RHH family protein